MKRRLWLAVIPTVSILSFVPQRGKALPTMVRLGYPNCASCHISPQGGGLLNLYGRSIDRAQSLQGGEYEPAQSAWIKWLNWQGRITQDFRTILQQQDVSTTGKAGSQLFRSRFLYRNATELGKGWRLTFTVTGENVSVPRPSLTYDPPANAAQVFVNTALLTYKTEGSWEFAVGRDQLPTGVNIADLTTFVRARNHLGYYDSPMQAKAFWTSNRFLVSPYAYGPGGNEKSGQHESGGGVLAEYDVFGKRRTIAGLNFVRGTAAKEGRTMIGPYARLGFGQWGILAEHDLTNRTLTYGTAASFQQTASYGQLFWAAREWLVPSLIVERLRVGNPYTERLNAVKFELAARLTPQVSVSAGPRLQHDEVTGRNTKSVVFQVTLKTVH
jgi:hypothetical protein